MDDYVKAAKTVVDADYRRFVSLMGGEVVPELVVKVPVMQQGLTAIKARTQRNIPPLARR